MAQLSLYRRYRPRRFGDVRGQDHVVRALRNAVASGTEGHAYLFSGPRGTGKTSTARILAKALNCEAPVDGEPCCECEPCQAMEAGRSFDLFELDAASNNGVDAVRDLVERTAVGSPGRTKVYILDEVHMLTAAASNALLKTLEEPPEHVRFVLATTDPQKVLPTIRSRTQHFEFNLLSAAELEEHVRWVVADAGLDVDDVAIAYVVRQGRGSARDTLSALDQVVAAGGVVARAEPVDRLFEALDAADAGAAVHAVADALAQGHDPRVLGEAFLAAVRDAFLLSLGVDVPHLVDADRERLGARAASLGTPRLTRTMERVGTALVDMRNAADPRVPLEVALVEVTAAAGTAGDSAAPTGSGSSSSGSDAAVAALTARVAALEDALAARRTDGAAPSTEPSGAAARPATREPDPASGAAPAKGRADDARAALEVASARRSAGADSGSSAPPPRAGRPAPPPPPPRRRPTEARPAPARRSGGEAPRGDTPRADAPPADPEATAALAAESTPTAPAGGGSTPDRDSLVLAMGDSVVPRLKGRAKAIYTGGRFVAVTDDAAVFAFDNAPTRDRAEEFRPEVERLLAEQVGASVSLRLILESEAASHTSAPSSGGGRGSRPQAGRPAPAEGERRPAPSRSSESRPPESNPAPEGTRPDPSPSRRAAVDTAAATPNEIASSDDDEEADLMIDLAELEEADVTPVTGLDRLTAAFPGAELIPSDDGGAA